jgi:hypothetical protein
MQRDVLYLMPNYAQSGFWIYLLGGEAAIFVIPCIISDPLV